jgi:aspartyl-tRNA synthetase
MIKRTKYCGQISQEDLDKEVVLCGWVHRVRNHGGVVFIDLRDREGIVQVVVEELSSPSAYEVADKLSSEDVICIKGVVRRRPPGTENPKLKTGNFEVVANYVELINSAELLPFPVNEETPISEEIKLQAQGLSDNKKGLCGEPLCGSGDALFDQIYTRGGKGLYSALKVASG